jgi:GTP:adenosylcobinamide-phosphate guanylyltransferase
MPFNGPIVIAAAGLGSRLGHGRPKALVEVGGCSVISRLFNDCLKDEKDIRVVVGFQEQDVIDHVRALRPDVIFVRNPDFRDGSARRSFLLAAQTIKQPLIMMDGDLLIAPASWHAFATRAAKAAAEGATPKDRFLVGVTRAKSTDSVFVHTTGGAPDAPAQVESFTRKGPQAYEWGCVACLDGSCFTANKNYVYECLEPYLPLPAFSLDIAEIDTPQDLAGAEAWLKTNGSAPR